MDLLQLNDYCLDYILSFLNSIDVLHIWRTCFRFDFIVKRCIREKLLDLEQLIRQIPYEELKHFFVEYTGEIRRVSMSELEFIEKKIDFEFMLLHWPNLEEIQMEIRSSDHVNREIFLRFLSIQKELKTFKICGHLEDVMTVVKTVTSHCRKLEELQIRIHPTDAEANEDPANESLSHSIFDGLDRLRVLKIDRYPGNNIAKEISKLKEIKVLHLTVCQINGQYLSDLKKLQELNFHGCYRLQIPRLVAILIANIDLKKLNIGYCCINFQPITGTSATQKNLEWLEMNSCFYGSFEILKLESLKHLRIFEVARNAPRLQSFLKQLAEHHRERLETLEIYNRNKGLHVNDCTIIPMFPNLKRLVLRGIEDLNDEFLSNVANSCKCIEMVDLFDSGKSITESGLLDFIRNCKKLVQLKLSGLNDHSENTFKDIVHLRSVDSQHKFPLTILLSSEEFTGKILQVDHYTKSELVVKLAYDRETLIDFF